MEVNYNEEWNSTEEEVAEANIETDRGGIE